jgi:predicted DNA-binding antitoxin AbrB/MazE fold protein
MVRTILGRYAGGAIHPLEPIDVPEGATVEVTVVTEGWNKRLRALLDRVAARGGDLTPDEIEAEITPASDEVRAERLGPA